MDSQREREEVEQYLGEHALEAQLNRVINEVVKTRPPDPFAGLASQLLPLSKRSNTILGVHARELLSSRGTPCLEVSIETIHGHFTASTATGPYDGDLERFGGKGMRKSVDSVHHLIKEKLVGRVLTLSEIDQFLLDEPNVPENVILAVSMACCRAAAKETNAPLHQFIADAAGIPDPCVPMPVVSVVNGGDFAESPLHLQVTLVFE